MPNYICTTCGVQYAESALPPPECAVCQDERQYVKVSGQQWITHDKLLRTHRNSVRLKEPGLIGIGVEPHFGINQRALLVRTPGGNVLWDCVALLDPAMIEIIQALGGLSAIAISHPHYYSSIADWSHAFGDVPIYLHEADRQWVMRSSAAIEFWSGEQKSLGDGLTLICCGGHFEGGTVLHLAAGAEGRGALLSGDIIQVVADRKSVSFMYSFPNYIPLSATAVNRILAAVQPFPYERIYGAFWEMVIERDGRTS